MRTVIVSDLAQKTQNGWFTLNCYHSIANIRLCSQLRLTVSCGCVVDTVKPRRCVAGTVIAVFEARLGVSQTLTLITVFYSRVAVSQTL